MQKLRIIEIIITIISSTGMSYIITQATIFEKLRIWMIKNHSRYSSIVTCSLCCGFHTGYINIFGVLFIPYFYIFQLACISSIFSLMIFKIIKKL